MSNIVRRAVDKTSDLGHASKERLEKTLKHTSSTENIKNISDIQEGNQSKAVPSNVSRDVENGKAQMKPQTTATDGAPRVQGTSTVPQRISSQDKSTSGKGTMAPDAILTGKQEHYLKRELISQQTQFEISELNSPTALRRFGAPFRSDAGEVAPQDSELPLLRYIFVHHVRNFPFLDQAREKEFWQDKLQVVRSRRPYPLLSICR